MSCVSPAECQSPIGRPAVQADGSGALEKPNPGTPRLQSATSATKSAQNGHHGRAERRPLSGVEQTSIERCKMSGDDPGCVKTLRLSDSHRMILAAAGGSYEAVC